MLTIEPLGTNIVLPAFVVGYELTGTRDTLIDEWTDSPDWLFSIEQQAGGHGMVYPTVVGCVLRLADNGQHCLGDVSEVVRGFRSMAEDPKINILRRDFPALAKLVGTLGDRYDKAQLLLLDQFIGEYFSVPDSSSGIEAFIRSAACDPLDYFYGWQMMHATVVAEPRQLYEHRNSIVVDQSNIGAIDLSVHSLFSSATIGALCEAAKRLQLSELGVFFLWENSD